MDILTNANLKSIHENSRNINFWEDYLNNLNSLNFSVYSDSLTVPILVPIGNKILFRGQLKHTNEVTVALGADYFTKCSLKQAEELRQHRIKDAQAKVDMFKKEKEYLENQLSFKNNVNENLGQEIIEVQTEEEDKMWRKKHRENVRKYMSQHRVGDQQSNDVTDEELWFRLEELELQEELDNEMLVTEDTKETSQYKKPENSFIVKEPDLSIKNETEKFKSTQSFTHTNKTPVQTSKLDLLQQVIDKQNDLEQKLLELKNKERSQTRTEQDLLSKLDEMEELDELEDEMDRLEDILETEVEYEEAENNITKSSPSTVKRGVIFADEDDSETIDIVFKHSTVEPSKEPYSPDNGLMKPSDIYSAYSHLFNETTSILKKSKYETNTDPSNVAINMDRESVPEPIGTDVSINKIILVKDVVEKLHQCDNKIEKESRPTSLFRKRRLQNKP
ncbi:unconventional prefoldin RPB5 interactor [Aphomia sociella]